MEKARYIIFFVLMIGGSFGIIQGTGAIDAGIGQVVKKMEGREKLIIPVTMFIFSLAGAMLGSAEEMLPFYPIVISLSLALGFDTITGTAMVLLGAGAGAGFAGAFLNPFTVGIAQGIAGLPLFSGIGFRLVAYAIILGVTIIYVYRYASKIQKNPELSVTYEEDKKHHKNFNLDELPDFNTKHKLVMATLVVGLAILVLQTAVLTFQFGDGFSNVISPTSGYFMAAIAIGGIKWEKWAKWMLPLFLIWSLAGAVLVAVSVFMNFGPF